MMGYLMDIFISENIAGNKKKNLVVKHKGIEIELGEMREEMWFRTHSFCYHSSLDYMFILFHFGVIYTSEH